jgi:hypothetical protein
MGVRINDRNVHGRHIFFLRFEHVKVRKPTSWSEDTSASWSPTSPRYLDPGDIFVQAWFDWQSKQSLADDVSHYLIRAAANGEGVRSQEARLVGRSLLAPEARIEMDPCQPGVIASPEKLCLRPFLRRMFR